MNRSILLACMLVSFVMPITFGQTLQVHLSDGSTEEFALSEVDSLTFGLEGEVDFPVQQELFLNQVFTRCEGIAFNGEGQLFVAGDHSVWQVTTAGALTEIAEGFSNLGLAPSGARDLLWADFGPTNAFEHGYNRDGIVWHVTPEGTQVVLGSDMGDPNFVMKLDSEHSLVSDDATDEIFILDMEGQSEIFTQLIEHPNGMVLSQDRQWLYVAQIFQEIYPAWVYDGSIWKIRIEDNAPVGEPIEVVDLGDDAGVDGLAMDIYGRIYAACWARGEVWRINPFSGEQTLICDGIPGVASLAFGRGEFDPHSLYATSTLTGSVYRIPAGVPGAELVR